MINELKELGYTENEIQLYLVLLKTGTTTPAVLAEKTGLSRSYIYDALDRLQEKELINTIFVKNKKNFQATNPKLLVEKIQSRLERLERVLPELLKFTQSNPDEIRVEVHKGMHAYKTLFRDISASLKPNDEVLIFGIDDAVLSSLDPRYLENLQIYFGKLKRKKIREKAIIKKGGRVLKEAKTTAYRFLPAEVIGNTAFEVYGNKVAIFLWGVPHHLILIENHSVAQSYKKQFEVLWDNANP